MSSHLPAPLRIGSPAGVLAVIPHLLGFTPANSLVVLGAAGPASRVQLTLRYDLPDSPGQDPAAQIAAHAARVLARHQITVAVIAGYGPGALVTPAAQAACRALADAGVQVNDLLRVQDGRYWSYLCHDPACCPPDGVALDPAAHPAAAALARAGLSVLPGRSALTATIAPVTGAEAAAMRAATRRAEHSAARILATSRGPGWLEQVGLAGVKAAITCYRQGGSVTRPGRHAWLALALTSLRIRDDAWARMDPASRQAHTRLWADLTRRAQPGYVAAPASLLAFTAWQDGNGALASIALDRACDDDPGYSMARLLREAVDASLPPSAAVLPMTPDEVAASYADPSPADRPADGVPGSGESDPPGSDRPDGRGTASS